MKNKAPLAMMEQLVMLLVFALSAALCLQVFVLSDRMSKRAEARDHAVVAAQNAAETMKICGGDLQRCVLLGGGAAEESWSIYYDADWNEVSEAAAVYTLRVLPEVSEQFLGSAEIAVTATDGDELFAITVCWQEVVHEETK